MVRVAGTAGIVASAGEVERALARPVAHGQALFLRGAVSPSIACLRAAEVLQDHSKRLLRIKFSSGSDQEMA